MLPEVNRFTREEFPVSELVLGVKCGSSDGFSGISANPSLGYCSDLLVRSGGTVLLTEVPEFCGAEHILANRAKDSETGRKIYRLVDWYKEYASKFGGVLSQNPSTGNKAGGLLNITIKSLGAIVKGRNDTYRRLCRICRNAARSRHQSDAGAGIRSGINAGLGRLGSDGRRLYDR